MSNKIKKEKDRYINDVVIHNIQGIEFIVKYKTSKLPKSVEIQIPKMITQIKYAIKNRKSNVLPEHIKIIYFPINLKKYTPLINEKFDVSHVNSGVTTIYNNNPNRKIIIFRQEEAVKVLLHELLHAFEYHCVNHFTLNSNDLSCLGKTLESEQNWDEAIVETWATILTNENAYKKRNTNIEKKFSIFQTAKILKHHGFNNWNEFWKPEKLTSIIQSKPAIFPYHILKSAFLNNLDLFKTNFNFNNIKICKSFESSDILPFLENKVWIEKVDNNIKNYDSFNQIWKNTMRMTYPNYKIFTKKSIHKKLKIKRKNWKTLRKNKM